MSSTRYDTGDVVRVTAEYRNLSGDLQDPTEVEVQSLRPDGTQTTLASYNGGAGSVVRASQGVYYFDVATDRGSRTVPWKTAVRATGSVEDVGVREFWVDPPVVTFS